MIDSWPSDEEMEERCGCGHTLGQHEYGSESCRCDGIDGCLCRGFHNDPQHQTVGGCWYCQERPNRYA